MKCCIILFLLVPLFTKAQNLNTEIKIAPLNTQKTNWKVLNKSLEVYGSSLIAKGKVISQLSFSFPYNNSHPSKESLVQLYLNNNNVVILTATLGGLNVKNGFGYLSVTVTEEDISAIKSGELSGVGIKNGTQKFYFTVDPINKMVLSSIFLSMDQDHFGDTPK